MDGRLIILLIIIGVIVYFFIKKCVGALKIHNNSIVCFTGGLGSGKTFMSVLYITRLYRRQMILYKLRIIKERPYVVSNIPIRLSKNEWSVVLTRRHLMLEEELPPKAIIFIDELGDIASQYEFDNPNVMCKFAELIRFYRHYVNGRFFFTDQSLSNIIFAIKRRTVINYCLENFRRGLILPTYHIDCSVLKVQDGEVTNVNNVQDNKYEKVHYFYGLLPRLGLGWRAYDSRCYSENYNPKYEFSDEIRWGDYKTDYVISLEPTKEQIELYKKDRRYRTPEEAKEECERSKPTNKHNKRRDIAVISDIGEPLP